jgi:hypothetical protein
MEVPCRSISMISFMAVAMLFKKTPTIPVCCFCFSFNNRLTTFSFPEAAYLLAYSENR